MKEYNSSSFEVHGKNYRVQQEQYQALITALILNFKNVLQPIKVLGTYEYISSYTYTKVFC